MSRPEGLFIHLDAATLATMKTEWQDCLSAIASGHQSYAIGGRNITRANLNEAAKMLAEITYAQQLRTGNLQRVVYSDFSRQ